MCKMVYFSLLISLYLYIINFSLVSNKNIYLTIINVINSWSGNTTVIYLFIVIFLGFFVQKLTHKLIILWILIVLKSQFFHIFSKNIYILDTLVVGTLLIHPPLFYFSILCYFLVFSFNSTNILLRSLNFTKSEIGIINIITLCLGGLWGLQSITWGYVWVNDAIEWVLLTVIVFVYYSLHKINYNNLKAPSSFFLLFNILLFIRLNLFSTRHSFFSGFNSLYIVVLVYTSLLFFLLSFIFSKNTTKVEQLGFLVNVFLMLCINILYVLVLTLKFLIIFVCSFFFKHVVRVLRKKNQAVTHAIILGFCLIWSTLYSNFWLIFCIKNFTNFNLDCFINSTVYNGIYNNLVNIKFLESISFTNCVGFSLITFISKCWAYGVYYSNIYIYLAVGAFLIVKLVEFRFLFKKKTYI